MYYNHWYYCLKYFSKMTGPQLSWIKNPVYRGVNPAYIKLDDYQIGSISFWPKLTSTSKDRRVAEGFSYSNNNPWKRLLFEIYLTKNNDPVSFIDLQNPNTNDKNAQIAWSHEPQEREVLILPYFNF